MRVLFDHQAFSMQSHGGVSRCFAELYRYLPESVEAYISVKETDNVYLRDMAVGVPVGYNYEHFIFPFNFPLKSRLFGIYNHIVKGMPYQSDNYSYFHEHEYNRLYSIATLKRGRYDIFHPTFFDDYFLPYLGNKPFVLTIHDMIPWIYSNIDNKNWKWQVEKMKILAPKAAAIVAVSENTKKDIVRLLNVKEDRVHVIYHGCSFLRIDHSNPFLSQPYILYVGDRKYYKNFDLFVENLVPVLKRHQELMVVCTGKSFCDEELRLMEKYSIKDRFIQQWVANDEDFYSLYHHAVCFVYTSEYEGFGIPILEAFQSDCPVMLNKASCFPEIAGDAAIYFEMNKMESNFAEQFEKMYSMTIQERSFLLKKQRKCLEKYSWKKSAMQLARVYNSIS